MVWTFIFLFQLGLDTLPKTYYIYLKKKKKILYDTQPEEQAS